MTAVGAALLASPTYVRGPKWHRLDGPGADAPEQGRVYFFMCYRWMFATRADALGLHRGEAGANEPICLACRKISAIVEARDRSIET